MKQNVLELTLLLMYLTSWDEKGLSYSEEANMPDKVTFKKCWKGYDFDILNELTEKGYLCPGKHKSKSVTFTKEGEKYAEDLIRKYLD